MIALMVLNWNGADLLRTHLPAVVAAARAASVPTRVIVIDNASADESAAVVAAHEGVELVALASNRKLHAYNDVVRDVDCDAFMMLNNDLSPRADVVDPLWRELEADPAVFAAGGDVVDIASGRIDSGPTSARWERRWVLEPTGLAGATEPVNVAYVSGGAGLFRRQLFLELGGFWEALPGLYWEDVELGLHAWLRGWRSVWCPGVRFDHASGTTVARALNRHRREFDTYRNIRLVHAALLLHGPDLRAFVLDELRHRPHLLAAAPALLPSLGAVARRRRELRRRCGAVSAATLATRWGTP